MNRNGRATASHWPTERTTHAFALDRPGNFISERGELVIPDTEASVSDVLWTNNVGTTISDQGLASRENLDVGGCQNYGPILGPLVCRIMDP